MKTEGESKPIANRKPLRIARIVIRLIVVGVCLVVVGACLFVYLARRRFDREIESIKASGGPTRIEELAHPPVAPENNSYAQIQLNPKELSALSYKLRELRFKSAPSPVDYIVVHEENRQAIKDIFAKYPHVIAQLDKLDQCPVYVRELDYHASSSNFMHEVSKTFPWDVEHILQTHAQLDFVEGRCDRAIERMLQSLRFIEKSRTEPTTIGYKSMVSERANTFFLLSQFVTSGKLSRARIQEIATALAAINPEDDFRNALKSDRAYFLSQYHEWESSEFLRRTFGPVFSIGLSNLHYYRDLMKQPLDEKLSPRVRRLESAMPLFSIFLQFHDKRPFIRYVVLDAVDDLARLRCLRAELAIQSLENHEDIQLSMLRLPPEDLTDPYGGKPLLLIKIENRWRVTFQRGDEPELGELIYKPNVGFIPR